MAVERAGNGNIFPDRTGGKDLPPVNPIEAWKNAPAIVRKYKAGSMYGPRGEHLYDYPAGRILEIREAHVMSTCERPWSKAAVDIGFKTLLKDGFTGSFGVLERGFGFGHVARRAKEWLDVYGGWYDNIELNKEVAGWAKGWAAAQNAGREVIRANLPGVDPRLPIRIFEGDAVRATQRRAQKVLEAKEQQADIIISDTFPLTPDQVGKNDILDAKNIALCLKSTGVFIFYAWHPGYSGNHQNEQRRLIDPYFGNVQFIRIPNREFPEPFLPPPSYGYMQTPEGPITELYVGICRDPRVQPSLPYAA